MSLLDKASLIVTPNAYKASKLYSVVPSSGAGDMDVVRATTATRVNNAGLIETVAANVPRLDYTNGSCPSLLVEPQRTNIFTYSEDFSTTRGWQSSLIGGSTATQTSNFGTSPDGTNNADRIQLALNGGAYSDWLTFSSTITIGQTYTYSIYIKSLNSNCSLKFLGGIGGDITKNITTQWVRYTHTFVATNVFCVPRFLLEVGTSSSVDLLVYGVQLELGSYPTSYIPTVASSVTRNADVISKTGISSLIGQTEGTLFVDFYHDGVNNFNPFSISNGNYDNGVYFEMYLGNMYGVMWNSGSQQFYYNSGSLSIGRHKMAIGYKFNDVVFYIDGILKTTDTSATIPNCSRIDIGNIGTISDSQKTQINSAQLYKTRLSNSELVNLTTL